MLPQTFLYLPPQCRFDDGFMGPFHPEPLVARPGTVFLGFIGHAAISPLDHIAAVDLIRQQTGDCGIGPTCAAMRLPIEQPFLLLIRRRIGQAACVKLACNLGLSLSGGEPGKRFPHHRCRFFIH